MTYSRKIATATALVIGVALTPQAQAQSGETCSSMQVLLSIFPNHRDNVMEYIAPRLRENHGVEIVAEEMGSGPMVERVSAQMPNPRVTLALWDVPVGLTACEQGLCEPIDLERTPATKNLYDWAYTRDENGDVVMLTATVIGVGLLYNEEEFERNDIGPPTSWDDLARPELAGRISITEPASTWGTAALVQWAKMGGGSEDNIDPGFARAQSLMDNMHTVHTWSSELANLMQLGEVWLGTTGSNMAPALRAQGMPVKWVAPEEGAPLANGGLSIVKGAPCQEEAHAFIDLYYSDEFQALRMRDGGVASPSRTAWEALTEDEQAAMDLTVAEFNKLADFDWHRISQNRPQWMERWQREIR